MAWPILGRLVIAMIRRSSPASTRSFWDRLIVAHAERLSEEALLFTALAARRNADGWRSIVGANVSARGILSRNLISRATSRESRSPSPGSSASAMPSRHREHAAASPRSPRCPGRSSSSRIPATFPGSMSRTWWLRRSSRRSRPGPARRPQSRWAYRDRRWFQRDGRRPGWRDGPGDRPGSQRSLVSLVGHPLGLLGRLYGTAAVSGVRSMVVIQASNHALLRLDWPEPMKR